MAVVRIAGSCEVCGGPGARSNDVWFKGQFMFAVRECDGCRARADVELSLLRGEFAAMVDRGIDPRMALRAMEGRIGELRAKGLLDPRAYWTS